MENLKNELKQRLIDRLNLRHLTADTIDDEAPLFKDGLGLDSLDALELAVMLKSEYGIELKTNEYVDYFKNINTLAKLITKHQRDQI